VIVNEYPLRVEHCARAKPGTYYGLGTAGGLGWGLGAALGHQGGGQLETGGRDARRWLLYVLPTLPLAIGRRMFHTLPILTIIFNNSRYGAVRNSNAVDVRQRASWAATMAASSPISTRTPVWDKLVEAHGGYGERVTDTAELAAAIGRARHAVEVEGRQALLDVICPY